MSSEPRLRELITRGFLVVSPLRPFTPCFCQSINKPFLGDTACVSNMVRARAGDSKKPVFPSIQEEIEYQACLTKLDRHY
jgi:hypothetical protein